VARRLRADGHDVYPVTLTGLGERNHLARPEIDLDTHISDVVNLIEFEDISDAILLGHSYAAAVVTGVADRIPERLGQLVYVDSAPFTDGMSMLSFGSPEWRQGLEQSVATAGDGWKLPFPSFEELEADSSLTGLGESARELMRRKAVAQPFRTWQQPVSLRNAAAGSYRRVAIACDEVRSMVAAGVPPMVAMTEAPWRYFELATSHWPMLSAPAELAAVLHQLAGEG
jgi:pimeloyl-ACP methyl ester carboxylesterase